MDHRQCLLVWGKGNVRQSCYQMKGLLSQNLMSITLPLREKHIQTTRARKREFSSITPNKLYFIFTQELVMPGFTVRLLHPGNSSFLLPVLMGVCQYGQKRKSLRSFCHYSHYQKFTFVLPVKILVDDVTEQRTHVCSTPIRSDTDISKVYKAPGDSWLSLLKNPSSFLSCIR